MFLISLPFLVGVLVAIGAAFWSIQWGWGILVGIAAILCFLLWGLTTLSVKDCSDLSVSAAERLAKFTHHYAWPGSCTALSKSCFHVQVGSVVVAGLGIFEGFWWGIVLLLVIMPSMGLVGIRLNPMLFLREDDRAVHEEIVSFTRRERVKDLTGKT